MSDKSIFMMLRSFLTFIKPIDVFLSNENKEFHRRISDAPTNRANDIIALISGGEPLSSHNAIPTIAAISNQNTTSSIFMKVRNDLNIIKMDLSDITKNVNQIHTKLESIQNL